MVALQSQARIQAAPNPKESSRKNQFPIPRLFSIRPAWRENFCSIENHRAGYHRNAQRRAVGSSEDEKAIALTLKRRATLRNRPPLHLSESNAPAESPADARPAGGGFRPSALATSPGLVLEWLDRTNTPIASGKQAWTLCPFDLFFGNPTLVCVDGSHREFMQVSRMSHTESLEWFAARSEKIGSRNGERGWSHCLCVG